MIPQPDPAAHIVLAYAVVPRLAVAALAGGALAVAGGLFQHALDNPLAAPTTLGVTAGAELALVIATLATPGFVAQGSGLIAVAGAVLATAAVLGFASSGSFSRAGVIVAGLAIGLFCRALASTLQLMNQQDLGSILLWNAGSLEQTGWSVAAWLAPSLLVCAVVLAVLLRPIALLGLDDASTRGLGLDPRVARAAALALAAALAGIVTAAVGPIALVELAAPRIAQALGARRLGRVLLLSAVLGAMLLLAVDTLVRITSHWIGAPIPTGAVTALLGAPVVLWLLPRARSGAAQASEAIPVRRRRSAAAVLSAAGAAVILLGTLSLVIGRDGLGWTGVTANWPLLLEWRWPRTLAALAAGAMLAEAGALLQRATGNTMAGPEVLGVGAAAIVGFLIVLFFVPGASHGILVCGGALAAVVEMALLGWQSGRAHHRSSHIVLVGLVLGGAVTAITAVVLALGDPRGPILMAWLAGSTAAVDGTTAALSFAMATLLVPVALALARPLELLPLGEGLPAALGLAGRPALAGAGGLAALLTAAAVLLSGPASFVGLLGPHLARRLGLRRAAPQLVGSALLGALLMLAADWLGRTVAAPFEIPAGLAASLVGAPALLALTMRSRREAAP